LLSSERSTCFGSWLIDNRSDEIQGTSNNAYSGNFDPGITERLSILWEEEKYAPVTIQGKSRHKKVGDEAFERIGAGKRLAQALV
jgi:hypothetical protein